MVHACVRTGTGREAISSKAFFLRFLDPSPRSCNPRLLGSVLYDNPRILAKASQLIKTPTRFELSQKRSTRTRNDFSPVFLLVRRRKDGQMKGFTA